MSLLVIDDMVEALGYNEWFMNYYYKIPNMDLSNGLKPIQSDFDVQSMCNFLPKDKVIEMYIEELTIEEAITQEQQFLKSMEVGGPSKLGNVEEENEEAAQEDDSDFEDSEYGSDEDNLVFSKFDGIVEERESEHRKKRTLNKQMKEILRKEQREEEFDTTNVEQNVVDDPYYNSEALKSVHFSDDEGGKKHERFREFNEKTDMKNPTLTLGLVFRDHVQFKRAVIMYSLVNGYGEIHFPRNEKLKVTAKCAKGCHWKSTVESEWNHGCGKRKAYRALDRVLKIIEGKHAEQYTKLWDFADEVRKTNPGSTMKIKLDRGRFQRIYSGCRPLIGLDGCHLKSVRGGHLLCVVGIDPNDETWVIVYAVVEMENKSSWIWFLELLGWTFISDQQNGLIPAFQKVISNSHHRFCVRHLYTNFKNLFKGKTLKDALWSVARATTVPHFKKAMEDMKKLDEKAYNWLVKKPAHCWSNLTGIPCNHVITTLNFKREKPEDYVDAYYSKARYLEVYSHLVMSMNEMSLWEETDNLPILPFTYTRQPGRLRRMRNKEAAKRDNEGEQTPTNPTNNPQGHPQPLKLGRKGQDTLKCTICKNKGHNARTHHIHLPPRDKQVTFSTLCGQSPSRNSAQTAPKKGTRKTRLNHLEAPSRERPSKPITESSKGTKHRNTKQSNHLFLHKWLFFVKQL
ncbi:hypothetical protein D8674_002161 [Pyrus ussuriensis x Pyrus communis]|uniref:Uncharacterized protein n=1 Tax=Pyrus ussuriensis x Pyrus communis TaxID=2448454 RepID=A0A5N5FDG3_9ROSA|nr:hypothetical protein D8674_002161 [Pyrus ussuriensis x Pyrus communis]